MFPTMANMQNCNKHKYKSCLIIQSSLNVVKVLEMLVRELIACQKKFSKSLLTDFHSP